MSVHKGTLSGNLRACGLRVAHPEAEDNFLRTPDDPNFEGVELTPDEVYALKLTHA